MITIKRLRTLYGDYGIAGGFVRLLQKKYVQYFARNMSCENITIYDAQKVNALLHQVFSSSKPAMVARFGTTEIMAAFDTYLFASGMPAWKRMYFAFVHNLPRPLQSKFDPKWHENMAKWSGFFPLTEEGLFKFGDLMRADMAEVDVLGAWTGFESFFRPQMPKARYVPLLQLSPVENLDVDWFQALAGKKVLVVHPFAKTIERQYPKRKLLFPKPNIIPDFELITIEAVQSVAYEKAPFPDWFAALEHMKKQMTAIDFDVAIIGAGAYGFSLAAHAKRLGKIGFHLGGATQLLFGIQGNRWKDFPHITSMINEHWVRPLPEETPAKAHLVVEATYW